MSEDGVSRRTSRQMRGKAVGLAAVAVLLGTVAAVAVLERETWLILAAAAVWVAAILLYVLVTARRRDRARDPVADQGDSGPSD